MIYPMLLDRIQQGKLHVDHHTLDVSHYHDRRKDWVVKKPDFHPKSGRARFRFGERKSRRTVYRNCVVWMYFNRRLLPNGYVIDHKDEDRLNDSPENLQLMSLSDSNAQGYRMQQDRVLEELGDFFLTCGFLGYNPEEL